MPRNKNNVFTYSIDKKAIKGKDITATWINSRFRDIKDAINQSLKRIGDTSFLNWIFTNGKTITNLNLSDFSSLLPVQYIQNTVQNIPITTQNSVIVNFDGISNNIVYISGNATNLTEIVVNFTNNIPFGNICVILTDITTANNISLIANDISIKPSNMLPKSAVFFQRFNDGYKVINTANFLSSQDVKAYYYEEEVKTQSLENLLLGVVSDIDGNDYYITSLSANFYGIHSDVNNEQVVLYSYPSYPASATPFWKFNEGDIIGYVSSPVLGENTRHPQSRLGATISFPSGNVAEKSDFQRLSREYIQAHPNEINIRPSYLYCGRVSNNLYIITNVINSSYTYYLTREKDSNNNLVPQPIEAETFLWLDRSFKFPIAKFGTTINVPSIYDNLEFEIKFNDLSIYLNGSNIINISNGYINNPIIAFLDTYNKQIPSVYTTSTINISTIDVVTDDFDINTDTLSTTNNNVLASYNDLRYKTTGGIVVGYNNSTRVNDVRVYDAFPAMPMFAWSMPSTSLSNGYIRFTKINGTNYKISGHIVSKISDESKRGYGSKPFNLLEKNTTINIRVEGYADFQSLNTICIKSDNMPKLHDSGVKLVAQSENKDFIYPPLRLNGDDTYTRPNKISDLNDTNPPYKQITINNILNNNGAPCFEKGSVTTSFKQLGAK